MGYGSFKNLANILKSYFGSLNYLYLLTNLTKAILLYSIAKCFPMQVLGPPPNPIRLATLA
jgi:hypothetical protein